MTYPNSLLPDAADVPAEEVQPATLPHIAALRAELLSEGIPPLPPHIAAALDRKYATEVAAREATWAAHDREIEEDYLETLGLLEEIYDES